MAYDAQLKVEKNEAKKFSKISVLGVENFEKHENFRFFGHFRFISTHAHPSIPRAPTP